MMLIENLLLSIKGAFAVGTAIGLLIGLVLPRQKFGCAALFVVPIAMMFFISWWQDQHPEKLSSTSALDFVFGPLWPSLGAVVGYYAGKWLRSRFANRI